MLPMQKVPNDVLLECGLELMRLNGKPLTKVQAKGRAMIFATPDKKTVRVRTCNDHLLIVRADEDTEDAKLNVEGTDFVLIVMPITARTHGPVAAYLVPAQVAADAARLSHGEWLESKPNTKGDNRTWNLWFADSGPIPANGFARKWAKYRLDGDVTTTDRMAATKRHAEPGQQKLGDIIAAAKRQIAEAAGISPEDVRITIDLS